MPLLMRLPGRPDQAPVRPSRPAAELDLDWPSGTELKLPDVLGSGVEKSSWPPSGVTEVYGLAANDVKERTPACLRKEHLAARRAN
jgi:hypothetical protein